MEEISQKNLIKVKKKTEKFDAGSKKVRKNQMFAEKNGR